MPVAYDTTSTASTTASTSGTTLTWTHTPVGTPSLVVLSIGFNSTTAVISGTPTYGAQAMTFVAGPTRSSRATAYLYKRESPLPGAQVVSFSIDESSRNRAGALTSYTGTASSAALGTPTGDVGTGTAATVDVSSAAGQIVHGIVVAEETPTVTPGAGQTERFEITGTVGGAGNRLVLAGSTEAGAATVTTSYTLGSSQDWVVLGVGVKPPPIENVTLGITSASSVTIAAGIATAVNASLAIASSSSVTISANLIASASLSIASVSSVSIAAEIMLPPPFPIGPPFDTALYGTSSPTTLYVALLSYGWGPGRAAVELSGNGYARAAIPNTTSYWSLMGGFIRNQLPITFDQSTGVQAAAATAFAIYDDATSDDAENLIAFGQLGGGRTIGLNQVPQFPAYALGISVERGTATLNVIELAPDLWSGYAGAELGSQWGVCQTCDRTVPIRELKYNRRYGWQCLHGSYGIGCFDGQIQRDEYIYIPRPDEGARMSPMPSGRRNDDSLPAFGSTAAEFPDGYGYGGYGVDGYGD